MKWERKSNHLCHIDECILKEYASCLGLYHGYWLIESNWLYTHHSYASSCWPTSLVLFIRIAQPIFQLRKFGIRVHTFKQTAFQVCQPVWVCSFEGEGLGHTVVWIDFIRHHKPIQRHRNLGFTWTQQSNPFTWEAAGRHFFAHKSVTCKWRAPNPTGRDKEVAWGAKYTCLICGSGLNTNVKQTYNS